MGFLRRLRGKPCGCQEEIEEVRRLRQQYTDDIVQLEHLRLSVDKLLRRMRPRRADGTYMTNEELAMLDVETEQARASELPPPAPEATPLHPKAALARRLRGH